MQSTTWRLAWMQCLWDSLWQLLNVKNAGFVMKFHLIVKMSIRLVWSPCFGQTERWLIRKIVFKLILVWRLHLISCDIWSYSSCGAHCQSRICHHSWLVIAYVQVGSMIVSKFCDKTPLIACQVYFSCQTYRYMTSCVIRVLHALKH